MKNKIRPIYRELQAYLAQAPLLTSNSDSTRDKILWSSFNNLIDELNKITGDNWSRFKVINIKHGQVNQRSTPYEYISVFEYRTKVNGLVEHLYGKYFFDEQVPFSGMPNTVINQHQFQNQTTNVQILLDFQSKIDEKLNRYVDGSKEKTFLEKIKSSLSKAGNVVELFNLILKTGKDIGLTIEEVLKIFL